MILEIEFIYELSICMCMGYFKICLNFMKLIQYFLYSLRFGMFFFVDGIGIGKEVFF